MSKELFEILVILESETTEATLKELNDRYHILQVLSPSMVSVLVEQDEIDEVRDLEGVRAVHDSAIPEEEITDWEPEESLFGQAWNLRQQSFDKNRKGDGLEWNAGGFEAPDYLEEE